MGRLLLRLLLGLSLVSPWAVAQPEPPLRVALVGSLRPLSVPGADSFERNLAGEWAAALGRSLVFVREGEGVDLWMGPLEDGLAYYQSEPTALTRVDGGVEDWQALSGGSFCIVEGSPYQALFTRRFAATARTYPTTAHALAAFRHGECQAAVEDRALLEGLVKLPEWKGFARVLPSLPELAITLRVLAADPALQSALQPVVDRMRLSGEHADRWINEVAFQAYVLADTLDCH